MKELKEKNSILGTEKKGLDLFSRYDESLAIMKFYSQGRTQEMTDCFAKGLLQDNLNLIVEKSQLQATNDLERVKRKFELVG